MLDSRIYRAALIPVLFALIVPAAPAGAGGYCMGHTEAELFTDTDGTKVSMAEYCFSPTVIRVGQGESVTWTNDDSEIHAVGGQRTLFDNVFDVFTATAVCTAPSSCVLSPVILALP